MLYDISMQLTAIELKGFKSFAGHIRLEFQSGITAVIGPNGSGKSNLAEAVRWVLGEQSAKQLRSHQRTDVIFSGGGTARSSHKAVVNLTFNNESGRFPVEAAEVTVSRILTRDGESTYLVNGDAVRLIDLQKVLAEAGIGAKSYTVISQGMVDRYLTASAAERQELFDEATGVRSLQIKLAEADRKLTSSQQHAHEVEMIIQELLPRRQVLKRQADLYQERAAVAEEYAQQQLSWYQNAWHQAMKSVSDAENLLQIGQANIQQARQARQSIEQAHWQKLQQTGPARQLQQQWQQEKIKYEAAQQEQETNLRQRQSLTAAIEDLAAQHAEAEVKLQEMKSASLHFDWLKQTRLLLNHCRQILLDIQQNKSISRAETMTLTAAIDDLLVRISDNTSISLARSVLQQLEGPLQAVARLKAIEQEKRNQLQQLPTALPPDKKRLKELEVVLQQKKLAQAEHQEDTIRALEEARMEEITAEREGAAALAATEQARRELYNLEQEILRELGSDMLAESQVAPPVASAPDRRQLDRLSSRLASIGEINPIVLKEYEEVAKRYQDLHDQIQDIRHTASNLLALKAELAKNISANFQERFNLINQIFSRYFISLFDGGQAELRREVAGIDIVVTPPGKRPRPISLLSGGEKALTALALLLAITEASQPPFIMMDEVDAALDEANSRRLSHILKAISARTQCIIITHNRETMGQAQVLYGVTMPGNGQSKIYSVSLQDIAEMTSEAAAKMSV